MPGIADGGLVGIVERCAATTGIEEVQRVVGAPAARWNAYVPLASVIDSTGIRFGERERTDRRGLGAPAGDRGCAALLRVPVATRSAGASSACAAHADASSGATAKSPAATSITASSAARGTSVAGNMPLPLVVAATCTVPVAFALIAPVVTVPAVPASVPTMVTFAFTLRFGRRA